MKFGVRTLQAAARSVGLQVTRFQPNHDYVGDEMGADLDHDVRALVAREAPLILDVGANLGQSVVRYKQLLPGCRIHSFEPGPKAFSELQRTAARFDDVVLVNAGVGATAGRMQLFDYSDSDLNSYLRPGRVSPPGGGHVVGTTETDVITLDGYCADHGIGSVDLLKIDTQGFQLDVLKGAERLMTSGRIGLISMEVIFSEMYEGIPPFDVQYRFLADRGFGLVAFYRFFMHGRLASFTDALFVHDTYRALSTGGSVADQWLRGAVVRSPGSGTSPSA